MTDTVSHYLRIPEDDGIDMPPSYVNVMLWKCPHCDGRLRERYPRAPQLGDRGFCGHCHEPIDWGARKTQGPPDVPGHDVGPCKPGETGVFILLLTSGEAVVGHRESADVYRRWTGEEVSATSWTIVPFFELWAGTHDATIPDLIEFKKAFPNMAALAERAKATLQ